MTAEARQAAQLEALWAVTVHPAVQAAAWDEAVRLVTEAASRALGVARVSVWQLSPDGRELACEDLYLTDTGRHCREEPLVAPAAPRYFAALAEGFTVDAGDALADPRTCELAAYLRSRAVGALLDAAVRVRGRVAGVLCLEHVGGTRRWEPDEIACASAFAERLAHLQLEREQRQLERELRETARDLRMFFELSPVGITRFAIEPPVDVSLGFDAVSEAIVQNARIVEANEAEARMMGGRIEDYRGRRLADDPNRDLAGTRMLAAAFVRSGFRLTLEHPREVAGAPSQWALTSVVGDVRDGRLVGAWGVQIDISDRKRAEEERDRLRRVAERERDYLRDRVRRAEGEIVGASVAIRGAIGQVVAVGRTDATVLLLGESGTGKELFARAIHEQSPRARGPLVTVNCAAVPRELFESEFFGHAKGAFTGATAHRQGRFELADGGTLFLDEVGEIPLELQGKLLRALQEGECLRVGEATPLEVDVRVVAATNRDLEDEVRRGRFRSDLFFRLSTFPIRLPPLRDRREDIEPIARHLLSRLAAEMGTSAPPLAQADVLRLTSHDWPGNVRELANVLQRALILARDGRLALEDALPPAARRVLGADLPARVEHSREDIESCLERHGGNVLRAASELGLSRQALYRRMQSLGVRRPS